MYLRSGSAITLLILYFQFHESMTHMEKVSEHVFSDKIMDTVIHFQVLKFCNSFYIWIGSSRKLGDVAVAIPTKYSSIPSSTALLGPMDSHCLDIAQRLAKKTGKQVFVSGSVSYNQLMLPLIEKRIGQELRDFPEKFYDPL